MKLLQRTTFAAILACSLSLGASSDDDVKKAEEGWVAAVSSQDAASIDRLLADDLMYTHSTGSQEGKSQYLGKLKSGEQKYSSIAYTDQKIRVYGNAAVVNGIIRMTGSTKGVPFDNTVFVTHVWAKQGGVWKLVSHQTTKKAS